MKRLINSLQEDGSLLIGLVTRMLLNGCLKMNNKEITKLKKQIERKFLDTRGWKSWEQYDKIGETSKLDINIREELIDIAIKIILKKGEEAVEKFINEKTNWIAFDDEIQKQIHYKIKNWEEMGRPWSGTFFTDSIFRRIAELIEDEGGKK